MSEVKIQRMINEMWELDGSYAPSAIGFSRQLVLDVYRRGEVQMYQRMWLDHGNLSELWRAEGDSAGGGGGGATSAVSAAAAAAEGSQASVARSLGDVAWWQRMVGLLSTKLEPSPDSALALLDFESLPLIEEV